MTKILFIVAQPAPLKEYRGVGPDIIGVPVPARILGDRVDFRRTPQGRSDAVGEEEIGQFTEAGD